jgi:hypothetical protein
LKYLLERDPEDASNLERSFQRGRVSALLDRDDCLAREAHTLGELLLRHLTVMKAQRPNGITNPRRDHGRLQTANR